jgi:hypothetical protein
MTRPCIICEGHTEAEFVKTCLEPHLRDFNVVAYPSLLKTRPGKQGGGGVSVERVVRHLRHEYHSSDRITTLLDFYGFGNAAGRTRAQLEDDILHQAKAAITDFNSNVVLPYVQMYEFEGLLFSNVDEFKWVLDGWDAKTHQQLTAVRAAFATPEDINNNRLTAPSKRILQIFQKGEYSKTEHGPIIASEIGLARIRRECAQFDAWVKRLEEFGG